MEQNRFEEEANTAFSLDTDNSINDLLSFGDRGNMPSTEVSVKPNTSIDQAIEKRCYTVEDLQIMLSCGRETIYSLLAKHEFRWFRLSGKRGPYRISKNSFDEWLDQINQ